MFVVGTVYIGELAQVVERPIRIRKVPGSMPGFSRVFFFSIFRLFINRIHLHFEGERTNLLLLASR